MKAISVFKSKSLSIVLTLVFPFAGNAQGVSYLAAAYTQPKPFLYEIEKDGKKSHILGSMHVGIPLNSYPNEIFELHAKAKTVAFEADAREFAYENRLEIELAGRYPKGKSLESDISPQAIAKLQQILGDGLLYNFKGERPWSNADTLVSMALRQLRQASYPDLWDSKYGIDSILLDQSKAEGNQSIVYLDDLTNRIAAFDKDFTAADLEKLLSYPDPIAHLRQCAELAQRLYLAGNGEGFKAYNESCETKSFLKRLEQRTVAWIPKVESMLKAGDAFIVVGADHMNGPNGLQKLLEAKGYKVKRVEVKQQTPATYYGYGSGGLQ